MAAINEKLRIILEAQTKGFDKIGAARSELDSLDKSVQNSGVNWKKWGVAAAGAGAALAGVAVAAGEAWQTLGEGAQLERTATQFDLLAKSIGTTGTALERQLGDATRGLISDTDLLAGSLEIMSGKLAKTPDQVVRMSSVVADLNWDMGVLAQTINNQSVLRLDNLGIAAEDVIPRFEALKKSGMDVKEAFAQALIEAGEAKRELLGLGEGADDTAAVMQRLEVAFANVNDNIKVELVRGFGDAISNSGEDALAAAENIEAATGALARFFGVAAGRTIGRFGASINADQTRTTARALGIEQRDYDWRDDYDDELDYVADLQREIDAYYRRISQGADRVSDSWADASGAFEGQSIVIQKAAASTGESIITASRSFQEFRAEQEAALGSTDRFKASLMELNTFATQEQRIDVLVDSMGGIAGAAESGKTAIQRLNEELDRLNGRTIEADINLKAKYFESGESAADEAVRETQQRIWDEINAIPNRARTGDAR